MPRFALSGFQSSGGHHFERYDCIYFVVLYSGPLEHLTLTVNFLFCFSPHGGPHIEGNGRIRGGQQGRDLGEGSGKSAGHATRVQGGRSAQLLQSSGQGGRHTHPAV